MENRNKGLFVVFEGCDGCGKTTLINAVAKELAAKNKEILVTMEPYRCANPSFTRETILSGYNSPKMETLLFGVNRRLHIEEEILPTLKENKIVLCDRFADSSIVYQESKDNPREDIIQFNNYIIKDCKPDITIFLDIMPTECIKRMEKRGDRELDKNDSKNLDFHTKIYDNYKKLYDEKPVVILRNYSFFWEQVEFCIWLIEDYLYEREKK